jgi:SPP1 gp7 family putative phage head morphogenesis protein
MPIRTRALGERIRGRPARRLPAPRIRPLEARYYARGIAPLLAEYREVIERELFPVLEYVGVPAKPRMDDAMDLLEHVFSGLRVIVARMFDDPKVAPAATDAAVQVNAMNRDVLRKQVKTVAGVDPLIFEPWLISRVRSFVKENVSLIRTIPTEGLSDIEQMVFRDARRGLSPQEMRDRITEQFGVSEARAQLIARDQVGKFNGDLSMLRQTGIGVTRYVWRTSRDERVRPDHARLDGHTFSWDEPPVTVTTGKRAGETNHPGQDIQCRCHPEPVLDDLLRPKVSATARSFLGSQAKVRA